MRSDPQYISDYNDMFETVTAHLMNKNQVFTNNELFHNNVNQVFPKNTDGFPKNNEVFSKNNQVFHNDISNENLNKDGQEEDNNTSNTNMSPNREVSNKKRSSSSNSKEILSLTGAREDVTLQRDGVPPREQRRVSGEAEKCRGELTWEQANGQRYGTITI